MEKEIKEETSIAETSERADAQVVSNENPQPLKVKGVSGNVLL